MHELGRDEDDKKGHRRPSATPDSDSQWPRAYGVVWSVFFLQDLHFGLLVVPLAWLAKRPAARVCCPTSVLSGDAS